MGFWQRDSELGAQPPILLRQVLLELDFVREVFHIMPGRRRQVLPHPRAKPRLLAWPVDLYDRANELGAARPSPERVICPDGGLGVGTRVYVHQRSLEYDGRA